MALRTRLLGVTLLLLAVGVVAAGTTAYVALATHLSDRTDRALRTAAAQVERATPSTAPSLSRIESIAAQNLFVGLLDSNGEVIATTAPSSGGGQGLTAVDLVSLPPSEPTTLSQEAGAEDDYRVIAVQPPGGLQVRVGEEVRTAETVVLGLPLAADAEALRTLLGIEVVAGVAILVLGSAAAWVTTRLALRPLDAVAQTARSIEGGDHRERIPGAEGGTELGRVITALNAAFEARSASEDRMREFVADASHELRTPLAAVRGWADLYLTGGLPQTADVDAAMTSVATEASRMQRLVDDLLALARLDAGIVLRRERVDLAAVAASAVGELQPFFQDHPTELDAPDAVAVVGDHDLLYRCLRNLVANAYRHTPAGTGVRVTVRLEGRLAVVEVRDFGPGFPPGTEERAFDRFWRADTGRGRQGPGGSGLGLPIAREIAVAHDGDLAVSSPTGGGAALTLSIPVSSAVDAHAMTVAGSGSDETA